MYTMTNTNMYTHTHTYIHISGVERGTRCEVTVGICHGTNCCQVTTRKSCSWFALNKTNSGVSRRDTRVNKRQEQKRETKSGGRVVTGGAVNRCGVVLVSRIDKIIGLFCERTLSKRRYSAKKAFNLIDPIDCSTSYA